MVDYIADYLETIERRRVLPEVQPGYLRDMLPNSAPTHAEHWNDIMADVEHAIMPGVCTCLYVTLIPVCTAAPGHIARCAVYVLDIASR